MLQSRDHEPATHVWKSAPMTADLLRSLLCAVEQSQAPQGIATRIVAIDGLGGAGKSTLAAWLAAEVDAPIIHTDDFASWVNPIDWWPALLERALEPLAAGLAARYQPTTWAREPRSAVRH